MKHIQDILIFVIAILFSNFFTLEIAYNERGDIVVINDDTTLYRTENPLSVAEQFELDVDKICETYFAETECNDSEPTYLIDVTDEEIDLMARVVMSESSVLPQDAKDAVAQVIVNRVRSDYKEFAYQSTVTEVINAPNQFYTGDNGDPTEECYLAVERALTMEQYPPDMLWFRKYNVKYGFCYAIFGTGDRTTYFSTVLDYEKLVEERGSFE